jgi:hypothetical protein
MTDRRSASDNQRVLPRETGGFSPAGDNTSVTVGYMKRLVSSLQAVIDELSNPGTARSGRLILHDCPGPSSSLAVGDVYVDGNGFLKLRESGAPVVDGVSGTGVVATVSVTIS